MKDEKNKKGESKWSVKKTIEQEYTNLLLKM